MPIVAIISRKHLIFKNKKSHMKKKISFLHLVIALSIWTYKKTWSSRYIFFSKNVKKITSVGSSAFHKKFTTIGSANTCNFFGNQNQKILISKKITTMGSEHNLNPTLVIAPKTVFEKIITGEGL